METDELVREYEKVLGELATKRREKLVSGKKSRANFGSFRELNARLIDLVDELERRGCALDRDVVDGERKHSGKFASSSHWGERKPVGLLKQAGSPGLGKRR